MCEPTDTVHLLKDKRHLRDNCLRSLAIPFATKNLKCKVNIHERNVNGIKLNRHINYFFSFYISLYFTLQEKMRTFLHDKNIIFIFQYY